ncbi:MAG: beta-lactamase family protein [Proteobacteria bacterium]|nr:beta-lactamase family protein [Pseudomonadota bacterium]
MTTTAIDQLLRDAVAAKRVPGVAAAAATAAGEIYAGAFGTRALPDGPPVTLDTMFWIASMTKALTSAAAMQQVERGTLTLDGPVSAVLPALAKPQVLDGVDASGNPRLRPAKSPVTLRQLLTHSAGYGYDTWNPELGQALPKLGLQRMPRNEEELARFPLVFDPGTRWNYGINTDLVGLAVEAASGQRLHHYIRDHVCKPLGMTDTTFVLSEAQRARMTRVHARQPDGSLTITDWPVGGEPGYCMGGGGISSTARDYLTFLRALLGGGTLGGVQILKPETVADMGRNHMGALNVLPMRSADASRSNDCELFPGMVKKWGLGFLINTQAAPGGGRSAGSLAWAGLGNTYFWLDPVRRVAGVILMQILPFADGEALGLFDRFERAVYASV